MEINRKLFWNLDKVNFNNMKKIIKDKECLQKLIDDYEATDYSYTLIINKIEIAFNLLANNDEFRKNDMCEFIEKNDNLHAVENLRLWLKMYGLPNIFVLLLNIDFYHKGLNYLEETLKEYNLLDVYNYKIQHLPEIILKESMVV